jgi:hypothetical protein
MDNNFLNRKKFNLDSFYNNSYKEISSRKSLIHPYLKTYINHININIDSNYINYNNLGIINNINNKNINYNIIENTIIIDSKDTSYNNSFNLNVYFNPYDTNNLTISKLNIKNIKYIEIVNILLPIYNLIKTEIVNNNELNQYINDNINILNINNVFDTDKYIDNIYINNNDWEINYSILINDNNDNKYYSIEKNNNIYKTFEYKKIFSNVYNDKIIYLKISQFNNHNLITSNDNINYLIPLCSNKIINNKKIYNKNIRNIIFKNANLPIINKLEIKFTDYDDNQLSINNLDKNINTKTSKSYIRHPSNDAWQTHVVLKLGTVSFGPTNS